MSTVFASDGHEVAIYGDPAAPFLCVQPVDEHDLEAMREEEAMLVGALGESEVCIVTYRIHDWNRELSPWPAPSVYGKEPFGDGATLTLRTLTQSVLPKVERYASTNTRRKTILAGYSLAGLFALWSGYETDVFQGIVAASPSVWYPGWLEYAEAKKPKASAVYLSLGDREERTRHPVMREVGNAIRRQHTLLEEQRVTNTLAWNPGNHFVDSGKRVAQGMIWTVQQLKQ